MVDTSHKKAENKKPVDKKNHEKKIHEKTIHDKKHVTKHDHHHKPASKKVKTVKHDHKVPAHKTEKKEDDHNKLDENIEKIDKKISEIEHKFNFVDKLFNQKWMKEILASKIVEDTNNKLKWNLSTIFTVVAVLSLILAWVSVLWFFGLLGLASFGFGRGYILIMSVFALLSAVFALLIGVGLLKKKKRLPFVILVNFAVQLFIIIVSLVTTSVASGMTRVNLVVMIALLLLILKNRSYFNK